MSVKNITIFLRKQYDHKKKIYNIIDIITANIKIKTDQQTKDICQNAAFMKIII